MNNMEKEENRPSYVIPKNYENSSVTFLGKPIRNVIEGAVMASVVVPIFAFLPIDLLYRCLLMAVFGAGLYSFGMFGIKQCCVSEYLFKIVQFKQTPQKLVLKDENIFEGLLNQKNNIDNELEKQEEIERQEKEQSNSDKSKKRKRKKDKK